MKFFSFLFKVNTKTTRKSRSWSDYKQDILVKQGREQFKKLLGKGLAVPVTFL